MPPFRTTGLLWLMALLAGCASAPAPETPPMAVPLRFSEAGTAPSTTPAAIGPWWTVFADPRLDALVVRAEASNLGLQQAAARLAQARAAAQAAGAAQAPQAGLSATASRQGGPLVNAAGSSGTLFSAGATLSLELDAGQRLARGTQAAVLDQRQREAQLRQARLQVQAEVATTWFTLRSLGREQALLQQAAQDQRLAAALHEGRRQSGLAGAAPATLARAEAAALEAQAAALAQQQAAQQHALAQLLGMAPGELTSEMSGVVDDDKLPPTIPAGIPSQVLARRADVAAAESAVQAARLRLGIAQDAGWPGLTLTAGGGIASAELGDLLRSAARGWSLAGLLNLPLFDGGRREAGRAAAQADLALAAAQWRTQMLLALREVEDQLSALRLLGEQATALQSAMHDAAQAVALAESRQARGLGSRLEVLDARRSALRDQRAAVQVQAARQRATVALVQALGGGWGETLPAMAALGR